LQAQNDDYRRITSLVGSNHPAGRMGLLKAQLFILQAQNDGATYFDSFTGKKKNPDIDHDVGTN
jgi:hypothetical protein